MASISQWLSVLKQPSADGNAVVTLSSRNLDPEVFIAITVPLLAADDEISTAKAIANKINTELGDDEKLYLGRPSFDYTNPPPFLLRARRVGHLINIWSQGEFEITLGSMPDGCKVNAGLFPVFAIMSDLEKYSAAVGASFQSADGSCLSDDQKLGALLAGSSELVSMADGSSVVATQYLHEESRSFYRGWNLDNYPVVAYDNPCFRGFNGFNCQLEGGFEVNHSDGTVRIIVGPGPVMDRRSIVDMDLKHSYVAGLSHVHDLLRIETIRFAGVSMWPANISKVRRGSGSIELVAPEDMRKQFKEKLSNIVG